MLWVPPGFAHGFLVTSEIADFQYKCTNFYAPEHERTIAWNDQAIGVQWGSDDIEAPFMSAKDQKGQMLAEAGPELKSHYSSLCPIAAKSATLNGKNRPEC
jgi:dTDP-4-dehydrorhamnose 3,5-epimerase